MLRISGGRSRYLNCCDGLVIGMGDGYKRCGSGRGFLPLRCESMVLDSATLDMVWSWSAFDFKEGSYV